jgi:GTP pyrophosphokinase
MCKTDFEQKIQQGVEEFFHVMEQRVTSDEMTMIRNAYNLAREAHSRQKRMTGEPYIIHPIAVARIVGEEMLLGANPVCAAFLHDVVEDTHYDIEDIERMFGKDVAFLVKVVTKQKKTVYDSSQQVDNFKQMISSMQYDIRAILIKLADRLHNMRTLNSMRADKQMKIAGETDYFYAPLANRLGLYPVKIELENLSFRYRCPLEYANIERLLEEDKAQNAARLDAFMEQITAQLTKHDIQFRMEAAYRMPFSVRRKMQRKGCDFNHVEHRHFVRIVYKDDEVLPEKEMALHIYALLTDVFKEKPGSMLNYIDSPKENGYQSLHVQLLTECGYWEEIHISSERMRRSSKYGCVAERNEGNIARWIERFRQNLQDIANHNHDIGFMEGVVSSFYNDDITAFTPQGRVFKLPQGSTALDFAFEVHSEIGLHAQYARINGRLCSVKTTLRRGDCVEIGTKETVTPRKEWMQCVHSYKAKSCLNRYFKDIPVSEYVRCPHCNPLPLDEVIGFANDNGTLSVHKRDCPLAISRAAQNGEAVRAIEFKENADTLYPVCVHVKAIDRFHLLRDLIDCISNKLQLSIDSLRTDTVDEIVDCDIHFEVHSFSELQSVLRDISGIENVEEVEAI